MRQFHAFVKGVDRHGLVSLGRHSDAAARPPGAGVELFDAGDACNPDAASEDRRRRQTTVRYACGARDRIVGIAEPGKCKYEIGVELQSVCPEPALVEPKPP